MPSEDPWPAEAEAPHAFTLPGECCLSCSALTPGSAASQARAHSPLVPVPRDDSVQEGKEEPVFAHLPSR